MKTAKEKKKNTAVPGLPMSESDFKEFIKEDENGLFLSSEEFKKKFDSWRKGL